MARMSNSMARGAYAGLNHEIPDHFDACHAGEYLVYTSRDTSFIFIRFQGLQP